MKKMYLTAVRFYSYNPSDKKTSLAARATTRAQRTASACRTLNRLRGEVFSGTETAKKSPTTSTLTSFGRLEKRASSQTAWNDRGMASFTPSYKKKRLRICNESNRAMTGTLGSGNARERDSARSRRGVHRRKKSTCSPKRFPNGGEHRLKNQKPST